MKYQVVSAWTGFLMICDGTDRLTVYKVCERLNEQEQIIERLRKENEHLRLQVELAEKVWIPAVESSETHKL